MKQVKLAVLALLVAVMMLPAFAGDLKSGIDVGGNMPPFDPQHVAGPDKGTNTCPVCKYGNLPAVQVWINKDNSKNVGAIIEALHAAVKDHGNLKAFVVFINDSPAQVAKMPSARSVQNVGLTCVKGPGDEAVKEYQINTNAQVANTVFVYDHLKVRHKFVNFVADQKGLEALQAAIKQVVN